MPENTFDIVSKIDLQEVSNAIQQALKEIHTRFDLKDSKSNIEMDGKDAIVLHSIDEYKLKAVNEIFQQKLVKRAHDEQDRRVTWNVPTSAAHQLQEKLMGAGRSSVRALLDTLDADALAEVKRGLAHLVAATKLQT
mgnify:CR=1 FL=1